MLEADEVQTRRATALASSPDEITQTVYSLWCEAIGFPRDRLDPQRNFLESGGYSLAALRLLDALRARFTVQIDLAEVFEKLTAAKLSELVHAALAAQSEPGEAPEAAIAWEEGFV
jgi:mycobactin peptide synthetase MbtE